MLARLMWEEKVGGPDLSSQKNKGKKGRGKKKELQMVIRVVSRSPENLWGSVTGCQLKHGSLLPSGCCLACGWSNMIRWHLFHGISFHLVAHTHMLIAGCDWLRRCWLYVSGRVAGKQSQIKRAEEVVFIILGWTRGANDLCFKWHLLYGAGYQICMR